MIGKQMKMMNLLVACALPATLLISCQDQSTELSVQSSALAAKDSGGERISHRNPADRQLVKVPKAGTRPDYEPGIVLVRFTDPVKGQVNGALADSLGLSVERAGRAGQPHRGS